MQSNTMKQIFRIQYLHGKKWKKTYFGSCCLNDMFHFETLKDAKKEIKMMHEYQRVHDKRLTTYRIVEIIYDEIIHEYVQK